MAPDIQTTRALCPWPLSDSVSDQGIELETPPMQDDSYSESILIVEDLEVFIDVLVEILQADYYLSVATDGHQAVEMARQIKPDLILLDIMLPEMDGYKVCELLKADPTTRKIPVIFLTARASHEDEARGLDLGAADFIAKPFHPDLVKARIRNHLEIKRHRENLQTLVDQRTQALVQTQEATIASLAILAEYRDPETADHIQRTKHYVRILAEHLASSHPETLTPEMIAMLVQSAPLHDIGNVGIPDRILQKPGTLTQLEMKQMQQHTLLGSEAIKKTEAFLGTNSFLQTAREIAEFHHEKWDGSGYPHGLKGQEIPLSARLMTIADVYDALISPRPYKHPVSHEAAVGIITQGDDQTRPENFDPQVLAAFKETHTEFYRIACRYVGMV